MAATKRRTYTFGGLLICACCGDTLRGMTNGGRTYYAHRSDPTHRDCPDVRRHIREELLTPWATFIVEGIERMAPEQFDRALAEARGRQRGNEEAARSVERALEQLGKQHLWGRITDAEYLRERERLDLRNGRPAFVQRLARSVGSSSAAWAMRGAPGGPRTAANSSSGCSSGSTSGMRQSPPTFRAASTARRWSHCSMS